MPSVGHRLSRITKKVEQGLAKLRLVHRNGRQLRGEVQVELDARSIHLASNELGNVTQEMSRVVGSERGLGQARQPQVLLGDAFESLELTLYRFQQPLTLRSPGRGSRLRACRR